MAKVDDSGMKKGSTLSMFFEGPPYSYFESIQNFYLIFYDFNTDRAIQMSSITNCSILINICFISFIIDHVLTFITLNLMKMISMYDCSIFKQLII